MANTDDFMQSLADGSGQPDIVSSFTSYIMQPGIPFLDVSLACPADGAASLTVTQSRYAPLGSAVEADAQIWEVPFAAHVKDASGEQIVRQMLSGKTTEVALEAGCPDWVMPNAGGAGYWRFVTDPAQGAALRESFASLTGGEQLMLLDSLMAGFDAGKVSAAEMMDGAEAGAGGVPQAIGESLDIVGKLHGLLSDEGRTRLSGWVETTYGPVWEYLSGRPAPAMSEAERLLAPQVWSTLLTYGQRTDERKAMADRATAYLGIGGPPDANALAPEDLGTAMGIGVRENGRAFYDGAIAYLATTQNQTERATILGALAGSGSDEILADLFKRSLGDEISGSELWTIYVSAMGNEKARPVYWQLVKDNYANLVAKLPSVRGAASAGVAGSFCTTEDVADADAFFKSQADLIPGYERSLAQGVERGTLCAARKDAMAAEVEALLAE
ncbi:MAG: ERAP1-like C-terminal domain-containing protein [Hyphomonas sp.]